MEIEREREILVKKRYQLLLDEASKKDASESKIKKMMEDLGLKYSRDPFERTSEILKHLK